MPMPIDYSIDKSNGIILEVWTGEVSSPVLAAYWKRLLCDAEALSIRRTLVDLRHCDIQFSGEQLFDLICTVVKPMLSGRNWRTALLVGKSLQYGVSRQYQSFAEIYSEDAIFHDEE